MEAHNRIRKPQENVFTGMLPSLMAGVKEAPVTKTGALKMFRPLTDNGATTSPGAWNSKGLLKAIQNALSMPMCG
jgi:hypothetical protein